MRNDIRTEVSGVFVKITSAEDAELVLTRPSPHRPEARYNRRGEDALYLSVDECSARVAMQKYISEIHTPLVLVQYEVEQCHLVDLRLESANDLRQLSSQDWRSEIAEGREPHSWQTADKLRRAGEVGLIDPSRKKPEVWHVTLFRWNEDGAPTVRKTGKPRTISLS